MRKFNSFGVVCENAHPYVLAKIIADNSKQDILYIAHNNTQLTAVYNNLSYFSDENLIKFPHWDCAYYDLTSPSSNNISQRCLSLSKLANRSKKERFVIITTTSAFISSIPPVSQFHDKLVKVNVGGQYSFTKLTEQLINLGFNVVDTARQVGDLAIKGNIIDIYPFGQENAYRIDFFGDEVECIRVFDPLTQRSNSKIEHITITPSTEIILNESNINNFKQGYIKEFGEPSVEDLLYNNIANGRRYNGYEHYLPLFFPQIAHIMDYLQPKTIIVSNSNVDTKIEEQHQKIFERFKKGNNLVKPSQFFFSLESIQQLPYDWYTLNPLAVSDGINLNLKPNIPFVSQDKQKYDELKAVINQTVKSRKQVIITCNNELEQEKILKIFAHYEITGFVALNTWTEVRNSQHSKILTLMDLDAGYETDAYKIITQREILGKKYVKQKHQTKKLDQLISEASSLSVEDVVVHIDHGVCRYLGLIVIDVNGAKHDCLNLTFDGGDKLYLPVENISMLSRYGGGFDHVILDKLGQSSWQLKKAKINKKIAEIAQGLIKLAAQRKLVTASKYNANSHFFNEFCDSFEHNETPDQINAINDIVTDLSSGSPMERIICGDVGFGKTEVAIRGAFIVADGGKQVVMVVPTTILCRQHYLHFKKRFAKTPFNIAQLSRLVSPTEAKVVKQNLQNGVVDILICTHAIFSKSIKINNLGLVILDEEHRFGVKQKEKLKKLQNNTHVISLTATPIPRTLQMGLSGVRDISIIATPPVKRQAVATHIMPFNNSILKDALRREYNRGGQSFFICPKIRDIDEIALKLQTIVPEMSIGIAHGGQKPEELESVMDKFYQGSYDILLSTNIVESGIDVSNANTMIIYKPHLFGLAQIYQIRGRVGRAKNKGYAYLLYPKDTVLGEQAQKRLEVIQTLDSLGAGFTLASYDLDIRGAGNILGPEQSGHIKEVGVELYQRMLSEHIAKKDHTHTPEDWHPNINLGINIMIPESYIVDATVRLHFYKKIANLIQDHQIQELTEEIIDRFGPIPQEIMNLFNIIEMKQLCRKLGVETIMVGNKGIVLTLKNNKATFDVGSLISKNPSIELGVNKIIKKLNIATSQARIEQTQLLLKEIQNYLTQN